MRRTLVVLMLLAGTSVDGFAGDRRERRRERRAVNTAVESYARLLNDGRSAEAAAVLADLRERFPQNAVVRALSRRVPPRAAKPEEEEPNLTVRTYAVADLVVPIPNVTTFDARPGRGTNNSERPEVDFDSLVELITTTIDPESWDTAGGPGSIRTMEPTLSLVIRQTDDVHGEIADLVTQLRRLQDVQVTVELQYVDVPRVFFDRIGVEFVPQRGVDGTVRVVQSSERSTGSRLDEAGHAVLATESDREWLARALAEDRTNVLTAPKVTLFDGQAGRIVNDAESAGLLVQTRASSDRRRVHLKLARDADDTLEVLGSTTTFSLLDGQTVVLDRGYHETNATGAPVLDKIPYVEKLFKNTDTREVRRLLVVTTRLVIAEEEEELLYLE